MELLYAHEHLICENYERGSNPLFESFHLKKGSVFEKYIEEAEILFVMQGAMQAFFNTTENFYPEDHVVLLPPASNLKIVAVESLHLVILRIKSSIHLCNIQPLGKLFSENGKKESASGTLAINERMKDFLTLLSQCLEDGLRCKCFIELKTKEVFYYFRAYYQKELLVAFFSPLLNKNYTFTVFVLQNYRKVKTVQQFADLYGSSLSSFEKQFKSIFRMSTYQWMTEQKSKAIYNDLIYTNQTLTELTDEYDFSSLSQFCDFCKRVFGISPGKIRSGQKCLNNFPGMMNK
ncbi:helix-turn-helix domain-containing protein [Parabacteroides sp. PF5-6]|uniref:helix-turn-helix domain-containing protein n=1 Tax=Parabacteroides sp. PF5-6 TaxID=1742403 RepID=UPI002406B466|nr:helix-turn-helix domain-containing protein [Parabacteroides sp. PF5-6]MDF9830797.1 AraC-like DNA-binding protein [Parabacteroides sp. PF5-6]